MKPLATPILAVLVALGLTGCAHEQMTNHQLARGAVSVGAAVLITGAIIYAEYRSASPPDLPQPANAAIPTRSP